MITLFLCVLSMLAFSSAIIIGSTLLCLMFAVFGIIMLAVLFIYLDFILLSSISLLAYSGFVIALFLLIKKYSSKTNNKREFYITLCSMLIFIMGISYILFTRNDIHDCSYNLYQYSSEGVGIFSGNLVNLLIIGLILLVGVIGACLVKYDFKLEIKKKNKERDSVKLIDIKEDKE